MWSRLSALPPFWYRKNKDNDKESSPLLSRPLQESQSAKGNSFLVEFLLKASIFGEFVTLPMTAVAIAAFCDLVQESEKNILGFSSPAVIMAFALSFYFLSSSAYMHNVLNVNHLDKENETAPASLPPLTFWQQAAKLSYFQRAAVLGHAADHAFAIAAAIAGAVEIVTYRANFPLGDREKLVIQAAGLFTGMLCTVADTKTDVKLVAINNIEKENRDEVDIERGIAPGLN